MKYLTALVVALSLGACASSGNKFDYDAINQLQPSVTTYAEAVDILGGNPIQSSSVGDGMMNHVWVHTHQKVMFAGTESVGILFKDGVMQRIYTRSKM